MGPADGSLTLPQKGIEARIKPPIIKIMKMKLQSRWQVGHRTFHWNLRTTYRLKLQHLTEGGADKAAAMER
jgi:hypothetical protein